jgi:hypothetical protein
MNWIVTVIDLIDMKKKLQIFCMEKWKKKIVVIFFI